MRWFTAQRASAVLLLLVLVVGAGNLWATRQTVENAQAAARREQAAQARQGERELRSLCATFGGLASLQPPAGNAKANPSRAYLQHQHAKLAEVVTDLHCRSVR